MSLLRGERRRCCLDFVTELALLLQAAICLKECCMLLLPRQRSDHISTTSTPTAACFCPTPSMHATVMPSPVGNANLSMTEKLRLPISRERWTAAVELGARLIHGRQTSLTSSSQESGQCATRIKLPKAMLGWSVLCESSWHLSSTTRALAWAKRITYDAKLRQSSFKISSKVSVPCAARAFEPARRQVDMGRDLLDAFRPFCTE
jgi:hypothetical protein